MFINYVSYGSGIGYALSIISNGWVSVYMFFTFIRAFAFTFSFKRREEKSIAFRLAEKIYEKWRKSPEAAE